MRRALQLDQRKCIPMARASYYLLHMKNKQRRRGVTKDKEPIERPIDAHKPVIERRKVENIMQLANIDHVFSNQEVQRSLTFLSFRMHPSKAKQS